MKKLIAILLTLAMLFSLAACANSSNTSSTTPSSSEETSSVVSETSSEESSETSSEASSETSSEETAEKKDVNVYTLKGPTGMGMVQLMDNAAAGTAAHNYNFSLVGAPTEVVAAISSGDADIAAVPVNVASTLYNKTSGNVQVLGVNTLGVLYILSNTEITSVEDLRGKTIYSAGQGATPEFVLNKVLTENGIDPTTDVTINFLSEHSEVIAQAAAGTAEIVLLPEPNVTALLKKDIGFSIALDMTEEWGKVADADLAMGCVIARKDFVEANPDVIATFLEEYAASVEFVNNDEAAAEAIAKYEIVPAAPVAKAAIPNCNIVLITGTEMQAIMIENLTVLHESNPAIVGGALPSEDFYYIAE